MLSMLQFLGRGAAFTANHNCALYEQDGGALLLDCPMSAFQRLMPIAREKHWAQITVLVTHTHGDHAGGIAMLIAYAKYVLHIPVRVIAPGAAAAEDIRLLLERLEGASPADYQLLTADAVPELVTAAIPVRHVAGLAGKCFGYALRLGGRDVIYTGDTAELAPFLPFLHSGAYLYTEASAFDTGVHLYICAILPELRHLTQAGVQVFLMHMDDEAFIAGQIAGSAVQFAPLLRENA